MDAGRRDKRPLERSSQPRSTPLIPTSAVNTSADAGAELARARTAIANPFHARRRITGAEIRPRTPSRSVDADPVTLPQVRPRALQPAEPPPGPTHLCPDNAVTMRRKCDQIAFR